jgi:spermidine synthase
MRDLNSSLYHTLQVVFPYVRIVPGDLALYLASTSGDLMAVTPATLLQRGEERELRTRLVNETYLHYKFDATRLAWFQKQTSEVSPPNSDLRPVGVFYGLAYWSALFSPAFRGYFSLIGHLSLPLVALPLLGLALVFLAASEVPLLRGRLAARRRGWPVPTAIAATGFAGMSFDLIIIFAFQAFYGYVYHRVGLLIPAFMAGLSLGGWLMTRRAERGEMTRRHLMRVEAAVLLYAIFLAGALWGLARAVTLPEMTAESRYFGAVVQPLLLLLNMAGGFLVGLEFPLAGHLLLQENSERERLRIGTISQTAGLLYAADLVGAFVGAVVVTIALLPVLGVIGTCIFLAALKAVTYSALA